MFTFLKKNAFITEEPIFKDDLYLGLASKGAGSRACTLT